MKNNKGFTLVELLAVVAILAVLVIITLPNIVSMYNEAKKNRFETELKTVYKTAQQQWMSDSLFETEERVYSRCDDCTGTQLELSGREELDYYVRVNKNGAITEFYASDGTYQFEYEGELLATYISGVEEVAKLDEADVITITDEGISSPIVLTPTITMCPPGKYLNESTGACTVCPANTYKDTFGGGSCTPCPGGMCTERGVTGATTSMQCTASCVTIQPINPPQSTY